MHAEHPALVDFIRQTIRASGPVSFAWFMEQALYHPAHGYYSSGRATIGRQGDYFTNVSVGPIYGTLLAAQICQIWERMGNPERFTVVEQGAHDARFAFDLMEAAQRRWPEFFSAVRYTVIEPFVVWQKRQAQTLAKFQNKVSWIDGLDGIEPFTGVYFSNELLDAMPVHLIKSEGTTAHGAVNTSRWREKRVSLGGDQFCFVDQPIVEPELAERTKLLPSLPSGYETEITALDWIRRLAQKVRRGFVLTVDYGFSREEYYAAHRHAGTLQCRTQHRLLTSPFDAVGDSDITAHVEWTSLVEEAESLDFRLTGFTDQHHFLTGVISEWPELAQNIDPKSRRGLQTLLHPEMLGRSFQVLALSKGIDRDIELSGFKYARDASAALGL